VFGSAAIEDGVRLGRFGGETGANGAFGVVGIDKDMYFDVLSRPYSIIKSHADHDFTHCI
jgi:hypothetical protein